MIWEVYTVIKLNLTEDLANQGDKRCLGLINNAYHWTIDMNPWKEEQSMQRRGSQPMDLNHFMGRTTTLLQESPETT